jgi:hypothetical protein
MVFRHPPENNLIRWKLTLVDLLAEAGFRLHVATA